MDVLLFAIPKSIISHLHLIHIFNAQTSDLLKEEAKCSKQKQNLLEDDLNASFETTFEMTFPSTAR